MPDPDDYKSQNSSDDDNRSSPNASKIEDKHPVVAQTPVSRKGVEKGKASVMSNKEKKEEAPKESLFKPKAGVPEIIIQQEKARQQKLREEREEALTAKT